MNHGATLVSVFSIPPTTPAGTGINAFVDLPGPGTWTLVGSMEIQ